MRKAVYVLLCLVALVASWLFWPRGRHAVSPVEKPGAASVAAGGAAGRLAPATGTPAGSAAANSVVKPGPFAYRLTNTSKSLRELTADRHAILLENALIDSRQPLNLAIPKSLQAAGDPGAYIVQARGLIDARFRALLASAGAQVVSYIPNNAYLVRAPAVVAGALSGNALVQAVLPYEPYYKLQPSLLGRAVEQQPLPPGTALELGLFASAAGVTEKQLETLGAKIIGPDRSPFGPVVRVLAPPDWTALAQVPGVQVMEVAHPRVLANDLSRATLGVAADSVTATNWLNLDGHNVTVAVDDSGVDATHPDLNGRVFGPNINNDTSGHGTHVAGTIAGNGAESLTVSNAQGSIMPATTNQFRGMAPAATLFSMGLGNSDYILQSTAALTNAPISNNSWVYGGDADYDLAAASYDAATRDALPFTMGSQPVLFVFAAGDAGGGDNGGGQGNPDTILSPGTAKNVITVGALEQPRNITNVVTTVNAGTTNTSQPWQPGTDSGTQVADYSSRGNVGIGTEGDFGRFKPDVVAPGTFVVSTRSQQWDTNAFLNPTNASATSYPSQVVTANGLNYYNATVPPNTVGLSITITPNNQSPNPFPGLPIYVQQSGFPDPVNAPGSIDIIGTNSISIPPDSGGAITGIQSLQNNGFDFAVGDSTSASVNFDLTVTLYMTNNVGDYYQVLLDMDNNDLGPWYRYESGTSMAAADISGMLALIEDYFTNTLHQTPSPALLKAMLINGARTEGGYPLALTNSLNYVGWGLASLPNSLPLTNNAVFTPGANVPLFFADQSPLTALATGDSHTYIVNINTNDSGNYLPLQATLVWTDPPGDPAAAIKLVNSLELVITNLDTREVYYGNDISPAGYNLPAGTNAPPNPDTINNVQNIILSPTQSSQQSGSLGSRYSVTVVGRAVNVNAVTAQTNNVVQDYALVVAVGKGEVPDSISSVTDSGLASNPTGDQNITFVTSTNAPLFNQMVGANTPLLGTNNLPLGAGTVWGTNGVLTIGMTNQWHFYVVTNSPGNAQDVTNAAFVTFNAYTLSIPRMGVLADSVANATRPEADIDLYVSTDPTITNLNPVAISNCLANTVINTANSYGASVGRGGTEFVYFTNSAPGQVYYVGVKSEDQMASEYAFLPVFTSTPFSTMNNGNQVVNGLLLPIQIPDGDPAHPGVTNVFALAVTPMTVEKVIVNNLNEHQNFGDLIGQLSFGGTSVVMNNHDGLGNTFGAAPIAYDDSRHPVAGSQPTDGPGSLTDYRGKSALGLWLLTEEDNSLTQTGQVSRFSLTIQPHRDLKQPGVIVAIPPGGWFIDYVDVTPGYTNLTFYATNLPPTIQPQPLQMFELMGNEPTLTDFDQEADLTNCLPGTGAYPAGTDPGNAISVGPPLDTGRYFVGIYNPNTTLTANVLVSASLGFNAAAAVTFDYNSTNVATLLDDAVTGGDTIYVPAKQPISSVNVGLMVNTPRISDLTFTLVSPTGQRTLLMENRGGTDTNGAGGVVLVTNVLNVVATNGAAAQTNYLTAVSTSGSVQVSYDFLTNADEMTVYYGTNVSPAYQVYDSGMVSGSNTVNISYPGAAPGSATVLTFVMNQFGNTNSPDGWNYSASAAVTDNQYLMFTDDTNLATVPIKFAPPPYTLTSAATNYPLCDFELATNGTYFGPTHIYDAFGGWTVPTNLVNVSTVLDTNLNQFVLVTNVVALTNNEVSVVADPSDELGDNVGSNFLALADGTITRTLSTVPGRRYNVTFWFRGPGISSWWRGEGNASDSSDPENNGNNGTLVGRFNFPAGEVGQAFQFEDHGDEFGFAGTNTYVQVPQNPSLDVGRAGGFTVEGWINPTNLDRPQPLVEWLAHVPTNSAVTNLVIEAGPYYNPATGHYYYLLGATNWTASEMWAEALGGHLATIDTANEQNWVFDNFANYGGQNRNLWIGLTNSAGTNFVWSSGLTNATYFNWEAGQPVNTNGTQNYTFMFGETNLQAGLWTLADNNGLVLGATNGVVTNIVYGVAEVNDLQTNGVQFWVSVTNTPGTTNAPFVSTNGCLYANIVDTNFGSHEIYSAPGLLLTNVYQHVALTFDTNSGLAMLYLNGVNVATTNLFLTNGVLAPFVPKTDGDVLLGRDMSRYTNNYFGGKMDEMSIYRRALSAAEIAAIYRVSATATNGLAGKFDPAVTPAYGLAEAEVSFGDATNLLYGVNNRWEMNSFTFTAASNTMPLRITGLEPGVLLDNFNVSEGALTNLYYLPEQSLSSLVGDSANGNWTLQVWDNRAEAAVTNLSQLVSWQLQFVLESNATYAASLAPQTPTSSTVGAGQTVYYSVTVPSWANHATNILVSSTGPVNLLYFSPANPPTGTNAADATLINSQSAPPAVIGNPVLTANPPSTPPLLPGQTYYLGVQNTGTHAASVVLEVDYDITALTDGVPYSDVLKTNDSVRYFSYTVSSNAYEATFQLLNLSGNADLVVRKGVPLPALTSADYGSFNAGNLDENIYVLTNSSPVPLSAGTWYLGVIKRDSGAVNYTVLAKELDVTTALTNAVTIIDLTNGVPFDFTAVPGAALTNFFRFSLAGNPALTNAPGLRFELYNLTGNGDLTAQTNGLPLAPPFYQTSQNPGRIPELMLFFTNSVLTNLAADWYLGVPNHEATNINYTVLAVIETNNYFPAFPGATGMGGGAVGAGHASLTTNSAVYHVINLNDSGSGSLRDAVSSTNRTVVFDISGTINLASPLVITNSYLTIAGQTAPGGGITVAGQMTALSSAHDVIIRDVRFRSGAAADSLQFMNVANIIADHVSTAWSSNSLVSVLGAANVTVQWSILADSLYSTNYNATNPPPTGSLLRYGNGALSFNHNLYADNYSGSPQLGDNLSLDFVNNVIYNWGAFPGLTGGTNDLLVSTGGCTNQLNYVCNYLIAGPDTAAFATNYAITNIAFFGGTTNALAANWVFQTNNFIDSDLNGVLNGANTQWAMFTNQYTPFSHPFPLIQVPTDEAYQAYEKVLDFAGVNLGLRDAVDTNIVAKVRNQTGRLIAGPGASPSLNSTPAFLDTDQDGVPDFWESTFGQNPTNVDGYLQTTNVSFLGYSRLEEYLAWLAGPHALTVTNTATGVDLMQIFGKTGNLSFMVTNAINGTVYLTNVLGAVTNTGPWSNSIAVFTPTNTTPPYSGYASFDVFVTNADTVAYFGPVTVSVVVSALPIAYANNTNPPPTFLLTNALISLTNNEGVPLTITNTATDANTNVALSYTLTTSIDTNAMSLLGWINPYANVTNTTPVIDTNGIITWTPSEAQGPGVYLLTTIVSDNGTPAMTATNTFQVTVNESNMPPFWPANVPSQTNYTATPLTALVVTNTAQDSDLPLNPLTYILIGPTNAVINPTNGIVTWTPTLLQSPGTYVFTTIVTDTNQYAVNAKSLSATNSFTVNVPAVAAPFAFTQPAQAVTGASAKLNGMATPNGLPCVAWFDWGTNTTYGNVTPTVAAGTGFNVVYAPATITGLTTNVAYHFRLVVSNAVGQVAYGFDQILDEANVAAWGADYVNQINVPAGLSNAVAVAGAYDHSLALKNNGTAVGWGDNTFGQATVPSSLSNVLAVAGGEYYSLALKRDSTVAAWGASILTQTNVPAGLSNVVEIAGGTFSSLALRNDGSVAAWGASFFNLTNVPAAVSNAVAIAGGSYHSLAVLNNGTIAAWGDDSAGQIDVPASATNVVAIAAGSYHSLALRNDGTVVAWGDDSAGQTNVPPGLSNVVAVAAGSFHSMALKNDGSLVIWGDNSAGQKNVPLGLTNFVAIAAGNFQSLALTPQAIVNLTNYVVNFTNGVPMSNNIVAGGVTFYEVQVPTNADMATNLLFAVQNGALNVWFTTNAPPTIGQANDTLLMGGVASASNVVLSAATTPPLVLGETYWLGVQNTNSVTVSYNIEVDFHFVLPAAVPISSIVYTNIGGTNGFLLTWFAPSNDLFQVQWTPSLAPATWTTFTNPPAVSYNTNFVATATNATFTFFDDGSQTGGFGPMRFYRLILLQSANTITLPAQSNLVVAAGSAVTVTNKATDSNLSASLTYSLVNPPAGAGIDTNGVITWPNATPSGLAARFTTLVTDNGVPPAQATNTFTVFVTPFPSITNVTVTATNTILTWSAPTNDQFQVQWTTNLVPPTVWTLFPGTVTSATGLFSFTDTNAPVVMKFYELILLP